MKKYLETEKLLRQTQKSYYETMLQKEEDTRRFRHDIINHLMCLRQLITEEKQVLAVDYIENLQNDMIKIQDKCQNIGNLVIDSILNYNIQLLGEDVSVTVVGNCSEEIGIHQVDVKMNILEDGEETEYVGMILD